MKVQFKPSLIGFVVLTCFVALFIKLGFWQYTKAQQKIAYQATLDKSLAAKPVALPMNAEAPDTLKFKQVHFVGQYEPRYQIYLDNQVNDVVAGFHIITPVKLENTDTYVLVNRGWVAANARHDDLPVVQTPTHVQQFEGQIWVPSNKFFTLVNASKAKQNNWQTLWQNMDIKAYQAKVQFKVLPYLVKLNADSPANGFARNWPRPDDRSTTHLGYAYQWFGFAFSACLIYVFVSFKKKVVK